MKTNFNPNYNQNFGMALYMPKSSKISKAIGENCAKELEIARPQLQKLAEDVDLYVDIKKSCSLGLQGVKLYVTEVIKSPIKRFFFDLDSVGSKLTKSDVLFSKKNISELLVKNAESLKNLFKAYNS